jgi:hypothetical protein
MFLARNCDLGKEGISLTTNQTLFCHKFHLIHSLIHESFQNISVCKKPSSDKVIFFAFGCLKRKLCSRMGKKIPFQLL